MATHKDNYHERMNSSTNTELNFKPYAEAKGFQVYPLGSGADGVRLPKYWLLPPGIRKLPDWRMIKPGIDVWWLVEVKGDKLAVDDIEAYMMMLPYWTNKTTRYVMAFWDGLLGDFLIKPVAKVGEYAKTLTPTPFQDKQDDGSFKDGRLKYDLAWDVLREL